MQRGEPENLSTRRKWRTPVITALIFAGIHSVLFLLGLLAGSYELEGYLTCHLINPLAVALDGIATPKWLDPLGMVGELSVFFVTGTLTYAVAGLFVGWAGAKAWARIGKRSSSGYCKHCGYCLTGNVSGVCPECGKKCETPSPSASE
jgi:hypothetical protein